MSGGGIWLRFGEPKNTTLKAGDALEEVLCLGWIDGMVRRVDDESYIKYLSAHRKDSKQSEENKTLAENLEEHGPMTGFGREKVQEARKNDQWDEPSGPPAATVEQVGTMVGLLKEHEPVYTNFQKMPPSIQKTHTRAYYDTKTDNGRARRSAWMIERLERSLKPM